MKPFWDALQEYRALKPANTKIRQLSGEHRRAIQRLQGVQPAKVCTFCAGPCAGRRYKWCSDACIFNYLVACGDPEACKKAVRERDNEICRCCGLDLRDLKESFLSYSVSDFDVKIRRLHGFLPLKLCKEGSHIGEDVRQIMLWLSSYDLWEIDHVIPVSEGGGCMGDISNLQTLCIPCHRYKTAKGNRKK